MKRDFDVIRKIMLLVEENSSTEPLQLPELMSKIPSQDVQFVGYQVDQAAKSGLIEGETFGHPVQGAAITGLTPAGHDFLDDARSEKVWTVSMGKLVKMGGSASLEVLKAVLIQTMKEILHL